MIFIPRFSSLDRKRYPFYNSTSSKFLSIIFMTALPFFNFLAFRFSSIRSGGKVVSLLSSSPFLPDPQVVACRDLPGGPDVYFFSVGSLIPPKGNWRLLTSKIWLSKHYHFKKNDSAPITQIFQQAEFFSIFEKKRDELVPVFVINHHFFCQLFEHKISIYTFFNTTFSLLFRSNCEEIRAIFFPSLQFSSTKFAPSFTLLPSISIIFFIKISTKNIHTFSLLCEFFASKFVPLFQFSGLIFLLFFSHPQQKRRIFFPISHFLHQKKTPLSLSTM